MYIKNGYHLYQNTIISFKINYLKHFVALLCSRPECFIDILHNKNIQFRAINTLLSWTHIFKDIEQELWTFHLIACGNTKHWNCVTHYKLHRPSLTDVHIFRYQVASATNVLANKYSPNQLVSHTVFTYFYYWHSRVIPAQNVINVLLWIWWFKKKNIRHKVIYHPLPYWQLLLAIEVRHKAAKSSGYPAICFLLPCLQLYGLIYVTGSSVAVTEHEIQW